jgi:MFS family permease
MMCMGSVPALLYLASILVGLAHGAHWTLMVATSSELFGLKHFGALYNTLSISATVGSYLLSVKLAGYIYDRQVAAIQAAALATGKILTGPQKCIGPQCFRSTFLVMAGVCGLGCLALSCLVAHTRKVYKDLYKLQQAKDHLTSKGSSTELHTTHITSGDQTCEDATLTDSPVLKANGILEPKRHRHLAQSRMDNLE